MKANQCGESDEPYVVAPQIPSDLSKMPPINLSSLHHVL